MKTKNYAVSEKPLPAFIKEKGVTLAQANRKQSAMFKQKMLRATQVPMREFICDLRFRHLKVWRVSC